MKLILSVVFLALSHLEVVHAGDRAVTRVVKMLEAMLVKSKADADTDRELFAKFKCYCDQQKDTKTKEIEGLTSEISSLEAKIEELQGSTGSLSTECAQLKADMAANEQARAEAQKIREEENSAFLATQADMTAAIEQMSLAIQTLSEVGADQTMSEGAADHSYFMASKKASLVKLRTRVREALTAASALARPGKQQTTLKAFLQKPFTATYTAQSGEVVGILKSMSDTFKQNLAEATATEKAQKEAFDKFMEIKLQEFQEMEGLYTEKQANLGENDGGLASSKQLLTEAVESKTIKTQFLAELEPMCEERSKEYMQRKTLRANEDAAIAEAISILNSDESFATFGKVSATSDTTEGTPMFFQRSSAHGPSQKDRPRRRAQELLVKTGSLRLAKLGASLAAGNAFDVVLTEIGKMKELIVKEGTDDAEKLDFCRSERKINNENLALKESAITALTATIEELTISIEDPVTGLKVMIANDETSLLENSDSQKTSTEERKKENVAYAEDISNLQESTALLTRAIAVLKNYYATLEPHQLEEAKEVKTLSGESEASPETWEAEKGYKGQSEQGSSAVNMLEFILGETEKEEKQAHTDEEAAQAAFEDLMTGLKAEEERLQESLATLKATLATKEKELSDAKNDLKDTEAEKAAILAYLASIKPGCDFMETNFDLRESRRAAEAEALTKAEELLKGTPAYQSAVAEAHVDSLGECAEKCQVSEEDVVCKACLAKVTVPGYCAGHPGTPGCSGAAPAPGLIPEES